MGQMIWRTFNLFIYLPEIRYKSDLTTLLQNDEARGGPFTTVNFRQYAYGDKYIQIFLLIVFMDNRNGEILCMLVIGLVLKRGIYQWYIPLTKITIKDIFIMFYSSK